MSRYRLSTDVIDNSSKGHRKLLSLLTIIFPFHQIYQEYLYKNILQKAYKDHGVDSAYWDSRLLSAGSRLHADIYDATIGVIFELQGQHHYSPIIRERGQSERDISLGFAAQQRNDKLKRSIANEAQVKLIEIPYTDFDKIDEGYVWKILKQ
jgi:hypothetical protein